MAQDIDSIVSLIRPTLELDGYKFRYDEPIAEVIKGWSFHDDINNPKQTGRMEINGLDGIDISETGGALLEGDWENTRGLFYGTQETERGRELIIGIHGRHSFKHPLLLAIGQRVDAGFNYIGVDSDYVGISERDPLFSRLLKLKLKDIPLQQGVIELCAAYVGQLKELDELGKLYFNISDGGTYGFWLKGMEKRYAEGITRKAKIHDQMIRLEAEGIFLKYFGNLDVGTTKN